MSQDIAPGTKINVQVTKRPTSAAAAKTLVRLLSKDAGVKKEAARLRQCRKTNLRYKGRGGRLWANRVPAQPAVAATPGVSKTIIATLDVLTDLKSVSKFIQVTPA